MFPPRKPVGQRTFHLIIGRGLGCLAVVILPLIVLADTQRYELKTFSVDRPPHSDWRLMTKGPDSIWFHRAVSIDEFSMISAMKLKMAADQWVLDDQALSSILIQEYRESTAQAGHQVTDEVSDVRTIGGKRFYTNSVTLPAIHAQPVDRSFVAKELIYIYIVPRESASRPDLYFFAFTDVRGKKIPFDQNQKEFLAVLKSFQLVQPSGSS